MKLKLGVRDLPSGKGKASNGDIAEFLEKDFAVIGTFAELHADDINQIVGDAIADGMSELISNADSDQNQNVLLDIVTKVNASINDDIKPIWRAYIDNEEHGIQTKRSLMRLSERFKRGKKTSGKRVSFVDTGRYRDSFMVVTEV